MTPATRPLDLIRQIAVIAAVCFMIVASMVGTGLFGGTPVDQLQGGALAADASYLAPASPAFSIWWVIYLGLLAYAVWQALPSQRSTARQRAMGWLVALTAVLNGMWLMAAQFSTLPVTVGAIVALLVALGVAFPVAVVTRTPDEGVTDALLIDGVTGLHLGWVILATVANIAATLTPFTRGSDAAASDEWGVIVLIGVGVVGFGMAWASRWRVAPGIALAWGLGWLAVGRLSGEPHSTPIGMTALIVGGIVLVVPLAVAGLRFLRPEVD